MKFKYDLTALLHNRHWKIISPHLTTKKIFNCLKALLFYKLGISRFSGSPFILKVETTDCCILKCEHCHDESAHRKNLFLNFQKFKDVIDETYKNTIEVILYHQGEPLIDPRINQFIDYAHKKNLATVISSNLSMHLSTARIEQLINSGLDYLIAAVDGITPEIHSQKRVGSKLSRVIFNLVRIIQIKKRLNSKTPFIEWQMIDLPHNKPQQQIAKAFAYEIGVDNFLIKPSWNTTIFYKNNYPRKKKCPLPWINLTILCDGQLSVCNNDFIVPIGNMNGCKISTRWNSEECYKIRLTHRSNPMYHCKSCHMYD